MYNKFIYWIINLIIPQIMELFYNEISKKILNMMSKIVINNLSYFDFLNKYLKINKDEKIIRGYYNIINNKYKLSKEYKIIIKLLKNHNKYISYNIKNKNIRNIIDDCNININNIIIIDTTNINLNGNIISTLHIKCLTNKLSIDYFIKNMKFH